MVYTKIQPQIFLGSTEDFQAFLPYMGIAAISFNGAEPFKKTVSTFRQKDHVKSGENCSSSFREDDIQKFTILYMYIA